MLMELSSNPAARGKKRLLCIVIVFTCLLVIGGSRYFMQSGLTQTFNQSDDLHNNDIETRWKPPWHTRRIPGTEDAIIAQESLTSQHDMMTTTSSVYYTTRTKHENDNAASRTLTSDTITTTTSSSQLETTELEKVQTSYQSDLIVRVGTEYEYDAFYDIQPLSRIDSTNILDLAESIPSPKVSACNCYNLYQGDPLELTLAKAHHYYHKKTTIADGAYAYAISDCQVFKSKRKYITAPLSKEEKDFPIAFSIMAYKDVEQFERLLRAIYHPQNYYCIHVDVKSSLAVHAAIFAIVACFDNVHMASQSINVTWGAFSVLEPDLVCMRDLWKYRKWRYFINLTAQEFPLKTNADLVRIMKALNGLNDIDAVEARGSEFERRTQYVHYTYTATEILKDAPPAGIRLSKGSMHITATRDFVGYVLHDPVASRFLDWVKDTGIPDETFFNTLHSSPELGVPGSYIGVPYTDAIKNPFISRYVNWGAAPYVDWNCHGQWVHQVCVFGTGDLKQLASRPEMFVNKLYVDFEPLALECLEELQFTRMREEVLGIRRLNTSFYESLPRIAYAKRRA